MELKAKIYFCFLLLHIVLLPKFGEAQNCPKNEEPSDCVVPCNTCEIKGDCKFLVCNKGCDCIEGFYRNERGQCIPEEQCPKQKCGILEEYRECGTACPETCDNYDKNLPCIEVCKEGCFCKDGFVRNRNGRCVPFALCPQNLCGPLEVYKDCGSACPETCENYDKDFACILVCKSGCFCRDGLVRNSRGLCVPPSSCPQKQKICTNPNERYYDCTPFCKNTCENYNNPYVACPKICKPGCFCKEGYVKRSDGQCVRIEHCHSGNTICQKPDEQYYDCIPYCKNTCENYNNDAVRCSANCEGGCFCKEGLVKKRDGQCVKPENCHLGCSWGERYYRCKPTCRNTCRNYDDENAICPYICSPGCDCIEGFVKNDDGYCVPYDQCWDEEELEDDDGEIYPN